jgi:hypothetical protein
VQVRVVIKTASEGVLYDNHAQLYSVMGPSPLLEHSGTQRWHIVLQMPMSFEYWPKHIGHGEDDPNKWYFRNRGPLLSLPQQGSTVATAGAAL